MRKLSYTTILPPGEQIIKNGRIHWIVFISPIPAILATVFFAILPILGVISTLEVELFGMVFGIIALVAFVKALIRYFTTEYALTEKRIIAKCGWIARTSAEIPLNKIASIHIDQSFWGRIIGYGSIVLVDNGGKYTNIYLVPHPMPFRTEIQKAIENTKKEVKDVRIFWEEL